MRRARHSVLLLLVASCGLMACSKSHGPGREGSPTGDVAEGDDGDSNDDVTDDAHCPAQGTRRAIDPGADTAQGEAWQAQDSGGRSLHAFSYTPVQHEDLPPTQTTAALQVRAEARTAVLIERDLPDDDPCRTELQLKAELILLTDDNAFRDVFEGTLSRTSEGTRFFARVPASPLKGAYPAPEDSQFRVEALLRIGEDRDGNPRESWEGEMWIDLPEGKRTRTLLAASWRGAPDQ